MAGQNASSVAGEIQKWTTTATEDLADAQILQRFSLQNDQQAIKLGAGNTKRIRFTHSRTGLDLSPLLKLVSEEKDRASVRTDPATWNADIDKLIKTRKVWALCSTLESENIDRSLHAANGLVRIADPNTALVLFATSKMNRYSVDGSESATLHSLYEARLVQGIQATTGLTVISRGKKERFQLLDRKPDYDKVEQWIRHVYLSTSQP